ncbi:hypothetical protein Tco_1371783, partial [Tanacetum coccineum]
MVSGPRPFISPIGKVQHLGGNKRMPETELNPEENKAEYHGGRSERFVH